MAVLVRTRRWPVRLIRTRPSAGIFVLALVMALPARAHDLFEIWTIALVRADYFEVAVTMAKGTALKLADPQAALPELTPQNFATHRAVFERLAPALLQVSAAKKPFAPLRLEAQLSEEGDIIFHYAFALPPPGRVTIKAEFLGKLGTGYGGIIEVSDATGNNLGWDQLSSEKSDFEFVIPAAEAGKKGDARPGK